MFPHGNPGIRVSRRDLSKTICGKVPVRIGIAEGLDDRASPLLFRHRLDRKSKLRRSLQYDESREVELAGTFRRGAQFQVLPGTPFFSEFSKSFFQN